MALFNRISRITLASTALLTSFSALAADPQVPASLLRNLERELAPHVFTLSRPVATSHWTHRSDVEIPLRGEVPGNDPRFMKYMQRQLDNYFKPHPRNNDMFGGGMYLASDPVATRHYGGRNWVLYQLEFKAGTRLLSMAMPDFSDPLKAQLTGFGCSTFDGPADIFVQDELPACKALRNAIARSSILKISGFSYPYLATVNFSDCLNRSYLAAFVAWDKNAFDFAKSGALIKEVRAADSAKTNTLKAIVQGLFEDAPSAPDPVLNQRIWETPFPSLTGRARASTLRGYVTRNLYGCGNYANEDI